MRLISGANGADKQTQILLLQLAKPRGAHANKGIIIDFFVRGGKQTSLGYWSRRVLYGTQRLTIGVA